MMTSRTHRGSACSGDTSDSVSSPRMASATDSSDQGGDGEQHDHVDHVARPPAHPRRPGGGDQRGPAHRVGEQRVAVRRADVDQRGHHDRGDDEEQHHAELVDRVGAPGSPATPEPREHRPGAGQRTVRRRGLDWLRRLGVLAAHRCSWKWRHHVGGTARTTYRHQRDGPPWHAAPGSHHHGQRTPDHDESPPRVWWALEDVVDARGLEPPTPTVSRWCANQAALRVRGVLLCCCSCGYYSRWRRDLNPCTRLCRPLPRLSATPPWGRLHPPSG